MINKIQVYLQLHPNIPLIIGGMIIMSVFMFYVGWQAEQGGAAGNTLSATFRRNGFFRSESGGTREGFIPQNPSTVAGIRNPSEPVPAGTVILAEEFSLMVEDRVEQVGNDIIIFLIIQNLSNEPSLFRYRNSSIALTDNLKHLYKPTADGDNFSAVKQFSFGPGEILSMDSTCHDTLYKLPQCISRYLGPIKAEAEQIKLKIDNLGPFNDIIVEIDL